MSTPHRIALATYNALPELSPDDRLLIEPLNQLGIETTAVCWDDAQADWRSFAGVIIRSCWDYHHRHDEFLRWIQRLESMAVPVWNPPAMVRWNSDKRYLLALERRGLSIVPSALIHRSDSRSLASILRERGWNRAVVKPCISASAHDTWLAAGEPEHDEARFRQSVNRADVLVQPYVPAIAERGEWSLIFLGGEFSHAALKKPAAGDFRVQAEHGGTSEPRIAPASLVASARHVLRHVEESHGRTLYARVDGYDNAGDLVLMELELIEPLLFLAQTEDAALRMASMISVVLGRPSGGRRAMSA